MSDKVVVKFKKLDPRARMPKRAKNGDAGYDLYALDPTTINPFERKVVQTGIAVEIPPGWYGRVAPRSGLAVNSGIDVLAGVIDSGYRDGIGVVLINHNVLGWLTQILSKISDAFQGLFGAEGRFTVDPKGKAVAQLIIEKCADAEFVEAEELTPSERGVDGYGSSDKK